MYFVLQFLIVTVKLLMLSSKNKLDKLRTTYKKDKIRFDEVNKLYVSNQCVLRKPVLDSCSVHYIDKLDNILKPIQESTESKQKYDLSQILSLLICFMR